MFTVETAVTIAASPQQVWAILTDLDAYQEWNPFVTRGSGRVEAGQRIEVEIHPPGGQSALHRPTVLIADEPRHFRWSARAPIPGLFSACHEFILEAAYGSTRLVHREEFRGLLVPLLRKTLGRVEPGFQAMNAALRARAEAG